MSGATFVLVHGAFRAGWAFDRLLPELAARGHQGVALDLPDPREVPVDLDVYGHAIARELEERDLRDVWLVGHSQGGIVIRAASQYCADRLRGLIHLDAPVALHGERPFDLVPEAMLAQRPPEPAADTLFDPWPARASEHLSEADAAWMNERLRPEAAAVALSRLRWDSPAALALPRRYLFCRQTPDTFPCAHGRARLLSEGVPFDWLDAPHDVAWTHPAALAEALETIAHSPLLPDEQALRKPATTVREP